MTAPTKIIQFKRPDHTAGLRLVPDAPETFPRFREEWNRPNPPPHAPHLAEPMPPPRPGK